MNPLAYCDPHDPYPESDALPMAEHTDPRLTLERTVSTPRRQARQGCSAGRAAGLWQRVQEAPLAAAERAALPGAGARIAAAPIEQFDGWLEDIFDAGTLTDLLGPESEPPPH